MSNCVRWCHNGTKAEIKIDNEHSQYGVCSCQVETDYSLLHLLSVIVFKFIPLSLLVLIGTTYLIITIHFECLVLDAVFLLLVQDTSGRKEYFPCIRSSVYHPSAGEGTIMEVSVLVLKEQDEAAIRHGVNHALS